MKHQWKQIIFLLMSAFLTVSYISSFYKKDEEADLLVGKETWEHGIQLGKWGEDFRVIHHRYHEVKHRNKKQQIEEIYII